MRYRRLNFDTEASAERSWLRFLTSRRSRLVCLREVSCDCHGVSLSSASRFRVYRADDVHMTALCAAAIDEMQGLPLSSLEDVCARRDELVALVNASPPRPHAYDALINSYFEGTRIERNRRACASKTGPHDGLRAMHGRNRA